MDDFLLAIVIIIVLIAILSLVSFYFPYLGGEMPMSERVIQNFSAGTVGYTQNYIARTQNFGRFGVGVPQQELVKSAPKLDITASVLGSSGERFQIKVPEDVLEWTRGGTITFSVSDTNKLGSLNMRWNGADIYSSSPDLGEHTISLKKDQIKADNVLEVYAGGPGLMFWATTAYELSGFSVHADYALAKFIDFQVSQEELETLDALELSWDTEQEDGTLTVKVNGEDIYSKDPDVTETVRFTDSDVSIRPGNNRLTFMSSSGAFQLDDVVLQTRVSQNQMIMKKRFEISESRNRLLETNGGAVKIYINKVNRAGNLVIKLNEQEISSARPRAGWNVIPFTAEDVELGSNWIEISGTGTFDVETISVQVA